MAEFVIALREERVRLQMRIRADEQTVAMITDLLRRYEDVGAANPTPKSLVAPLSVDEKPQPFVRSESGMHRVLEAAAEYIRNKGARAQSPEILGEMIRLGLMRQDQGQVLSSYLSRTKEMFDNKRGQGYGLREWSSHRPAVDGGPRPMIHQ